MVRIVLCGYMVRFERRIAIGMRIRLLTNRMRRSPPTTFSPAPKYMIRLRASFP